MKERIRKLRKECCIFSEAIKKEECMLENQRDKDTGFVEQRGFDYCETQGASGIKAVLLQELLK